MFLGFELHPYRILFQKVQIRTSSLQTLTNFQRLLGDINWLCPYLKLTTGELKPLFYILKGDANPSSLRHITSEAQQALQKVNRATAQQNVGYFSPNQPIYLLIFPTPFTPTGLLWQHAPLFWVHLPASPVKILSTYPQLVALLA